ncbi:MAG: hypothetical protein FWC20_09725 [Oscillospiraceae bacterium]|nr:hypothetical protein [Oscillospiraceae bacterium]MCL2279666.1 hypothetical protein [Oscillospiraceae bacterium]
MKKLKLYLDTSVISHLHQPDALEKQEDTRKLWELIKANIYTNNISIGRCRR